MMAFKPLWIAASVALAMLSVPAAASAQTLKVVDPGKLPVVGRTDPRFASYNIDFATLTGTTAQAADRPKPQAGDALGGAASPLLLGPHQYRPPIDLANPRLRALAAGLAPAYVRASGTSANTVYFQDDDKPVLQKPPAGYSTVLTRAQWKALIDFARAADAKLLTSFTVNGPVRDASGTWTPLLAKPLVDYTHRIGGRIDAAELFNEPNLPKFGGGPADYDGDGFARDVAAFRAFARDAAPEMKIVGPGDVTAANLPVPGALTPEQLMSGTPKPRFDIVSYHFYPAVSARCAPPESPAGTSPERALTEEWLARADKSFQIHKALRDRYAPGAPIWDTETGGAACGGAAWDTTFLDSFRYLDMLGRLSKQGADVVFHQTLAGSDYGLLDPDTFDPRPNYWAAFLWKRLMGPTILDAGPGRPGLHLYAACLRDTPGGVALLAINTQTSAARLQVSGQADLYLLTAPELQSRTVLLNDQPLALGPTNQLPPLRPRPARGGQVTLAPTSIGFIAFPQARNAACR